ncbi:MAG: TonB-dependent receptor [Kiritimatiellae bacterium]|nr:TonB-dependent receptor [Kiritimatiellia bacterium]
MGERRVRCVGLRRVCMVLSLWACVVIPTIAIAQSKAANDSDVNHLMQLSLSQLTEIPVTSVSKKPENIEGTPSAAFVVTAEDIRRSGATALPDVLRMVPGVEVVQVDDNDWYVAIRGFNGETGNKLLVLVDGRTIYSPVFSGVFWYMHDFVLEDIERVEVVRGPGGAVWGANAVNGIINIITKHAKDQQGGMTSVTTGTFDRFSATARYGGKVGEDGYAAAWVKVWEREQWDEDRNADLVVPHDWQSVMTGFRYDWDPATPDAFSLHGSWHEVQASDNFYTHEFQPPYNQMIEYDRVDTLFHLFGKYSHRFSEESEFSLQAYYDRTHNDYGNGDLLYETYDLESQVRFGLGESHDIICGVGYRLVMDDLDPDDEYGITFFQPQKAERDVESLFVEDEITVVPERLSVKLGARLEHNEYTGWEVQPNARFHFRPWDRQVVWGAVSRAVHTPARLASDATGVSVAAPSRLPAQFAGLNVPVIHWIDEADMDSEEVVSYELGYRCTPTDRFWFDTALFYSDYDKLRTFAAQSPGFQITPLGLETHAAMNNGKEGHSYGGEVSSTLRVTRNWALIAAYSHLKLDLDLKEGAIDIAGITTVEGYSPENQFSLRSQWDVTPTLECDVWLRYVDELAAIDVDAYTTVDVRLAWQARDNLSLELVGRNLAEEWHEEYFIGYEVERSLHAKATWMF